MNRVRLGAYNNSWYHPGQSRLVQILWFFLGLPLLRSRILPSSGFRVWLLRRFGAEIGSGAVIKPGVCIKYPWHLRIGNDCWLGEGVWIDNLTTVTLGSDVCVSQAAYLCTGNHDWTDPAFGLIIKPITLDDGAWVGAGALLAPGTHLRSCAVAAAGSVVSGTVPPFEIHAGNPATFHRVRRFQGDEEPAQQETKLKAIGRGA